ncbi:hypothetical protein LC653_35950 [Nostoc sp. CHAB 5784]|uniref:hypothetical protein n=1 Tax=Nostoc mirabile TaxID=2907820 RepID=UPI001E5DFFF1|nr:hypothetical protein [Nostoc mirabile]MCC5669109.1 hypothetical protein [Nostoc mirabile CHAB5784]
MHDNCAIAYSPDGVLTLNWFVVNYNCMSDFAIYPEALFALRMFACAGVKASKNAIALRAIYGRCFFNACRESFANTLR